MRRNLSLGTALVRAAVKAAVKAADRDVTVAIRAADWVG